MDTRGALKKLIEDIGVPSRAVCPKCHGGSTRENCMTLYKGDNGEVLATCHRAACDFGTISLETRYRDDMAPELPPHAVLDWTGIWEESIPLPVGIQLPCKFEYTSRLRALMMKYHKERHSLVFPIKGFDPSSNHVYLRDQYGIVVKSLIDSSGPKSLTLADKGRTGLAWFRISSLPSPVVCVEDCLSALALRDLGVTAVSLNGTHINDDRFSEIRRVSPHIVIMLDADATRNAARIVTKYLGRANMKVVRLEDDIKDMTRAAVSKLLIQHNIYRGYREPHC